MHQPHGGPGIDMESRHEAATPLPGYAYPPPVQYVVAAPPPGYIAVPAPMAVQWIQQRPTALTYWGLACSIAALGLPFLAWSMNQISDGALRPLPQIISLPTPVLLVLGIVFSAIALSRRYTRRGMAVAGLATGLAWILLVLSLVVVDSL